MSTFVSEANRLKSIQQNLEKNEVILLEQIFKTEGGKSIGEFFKETSASRATEIEKLRDDVKDVIEPLKKVKESVRKDIKNIDVKILKKEMTAIQNNIQTLKSTTKTTLEILNKDEEKLIEEVNAFQQKIQDWDKPSMNNSRKKCVAGKTSVSVPKNICQEAKDFMAFVEEHGGYENGWAVDDHNLFLKARTKTKGVEKLAEIIHALLPDISEEEVIEHEKWYQKYVELKERQKNAIQNWRESKARANGKTRSKVEADWKRFEKSVLASYADSIDKEIQQQKISEWKAQKRAEKLNQHRQKQLEQMKRKELEKMRKQKQEELKEEVNNWRTTKKVAEEAKKIEQMTMKRNERKNRAVMANKLIKQYQFQDEQFLQRKLQMLQAGPKSTEIEVIRSKHEAVRDPERLFKPTRQWILRTYGGSDESTNHLSLQTIPKLGIPEWRRGIV